jgi:selenophosphate synthetase-related protein
VTDLAALAEHLRALPGVRAKADIGLVADVLGGADRYAGPGDDGAVLPGGGGSVVVGGEAILPRFVAADPYGAGIAAVPANVNDLAAMGARPGALLDTVVGPPEPTREILLPVPGGVPPADWLACFPAFVFLLTCPPERVEDCLAGFRGRGLTAATLGVLDDTGRIRLARSGDEATVFDLSREGVTDLRR